MISLSPRMNNSWPSTEGWRSSVIVASNRMIQSAIKESEQRGTTSGLSITPHTESSWKHEEKTKLSESAAVELPHSKPSGSFEPLQEWEGFVTSIDPRGTHFATRLIDKTAKKKLADEELEISLEDVSESDLHLLKEGAVFRLAIGYERSASGQRRKVSMLVFRRLPAWTARELVRAFEEGRAAAASLKWA